MKLLPFKVLFFSLLSIIGCKESLKIQDEDIITIGDVSLKLKDKCYCSISNHNVISELADTITYSFNFKDIVKIDTTYSSYVIIYINSPNNMSRQIYWRNYISENEKKRFFKKKEKAIFNFTQKNNISVFIELVYKHAKKCNANLAK